MSSYRGHCHHKFFGTYTSCVNAMPHVSPISYTHTRWVYAMPHVSHGWKRSLILVTFPFEGSHAWFNLVLLRLMMQNYSKSINFAEFWQYNG